MANATFLPVREPELVVWLENFKSRTTLSPLIYGITVGQATIFGGLTDSFVAAFNLCNSDATNSRSNVLAKNSAKTAVIANARLLSGIIQKFPGTTNQMRGDLGLTVPSVPAPVPVPVVTPAIDILKVSGTTVSIKIHKGDSSKRGKPPGVAGAYIYTYVGDTAPGDIAAWTFQGCATKTTFDVPLSGNAPSDRFTRRRIHDERPDTTHPAHP